MEKIAPNGMPLFIILYGGGNRGCGPSLPPEVQAASGKIGRPTAYCPQEPGPPVSPDGRPTVSHLVSDPSFFQLFFLSFSWKCILDFNDASLCIGSYALTSF